MAGAAGGLWGMLFPITPIMGGALTLKSFVVAVLGGPSGTGLRTPESLMRAMPGSCAVWSPFGKKWSAKRRPRCTRTPARC